MNTKQVQQLLRAVAAHENRELSDGFIDAVLKTAPPITLSKTFRDHALTAIQAAQQRRLDALNKSK